MEPAPPVRAPQATRDLFDLTAWPRWRRLAITGSQNPNYRHGRFSGRRRRMEAMLNRATRELGYVPGQREQAPILRWGIKIHQLPYGARTRALEVLGALMEHWPDRWALPDERRIRPHQWAWYVPRVAWAACTAWLRHFVTLQRLVTFGLSVILAPMPPLLRRGSRDSISEGFAARQDEARRQLRAWADRHGYAMEAPVT